MQNIVWKILLIVAVIALCLWSVYPPDQKVRLGRDLQGGTSLIYLVHVPEGLDKESVIDQTIRVLKDRVNPKGVLDISMQPVGADRIEIIMPLPNEEVLRLRKEFQDALGELARESEIKVVELDESLRYNRAVEQFGGTNQTRTAQMESLQKAHNELQAARQQLADAKTSDAGVEAIRRAEQAVAEAQFAYDQQREAVLKLSLEQSRLVRTLNLSSETEAQRDAQGRIVRDEKGEPVQMPSPRKIGLDGLRTEFPHLADQIAHVAAKFDQYQDKRTTLDDPEDLMRLLRGAGVLEYRIAVRQSSAAGVNIQQMREQLQEVGPDHTDSPVTRWFPINELKQWYKTPEDLAALQADPEGFFARRDLVAARYDGQYYLLLYTSPNKSMTHGTGTKWSVVTTFPTQDDLGRPAVGFRLDDAGGAMMNRLTGAHLNEPMAIVLDGQVYSAPSINSAIGKNGIIQGSFSQNELDYLTRVLAAGALEARLSDQPIAINTLGPSLGKDNLQRGLQACVFSILITAAIMFGYYFMAGAVANIALLINAIIIFGVMAMIQGTFTLPGLAGIALSIAMAVDANVLIYERIREELVNNKEDLRTAIRLGYQRAMSAIIDGNLTNLIVCVVLLYTATTEVKGFAYTMILGVLATLFSALFITRVLYTLYTEWLRARKLPMLATVFPAIHRALEPSINWIGKRAIFLSIAVIAAIGSLVVFFNRGAEMLDTEFRGGLTMTMQTRAARDGEPAGADGRLLLSRPQVESEVHEIGESASPQSPVHQLRTASVLTVGDMTPDFRAARFQIKVAAPQGTEDEATITDDVVQSIVQRFGDRLAVTPALNFAGAEQFEARSFNHNAFTFPVEDEILGVNINRPQYTQSVDRFRGGVAIVIDDLSPAVTPSEAEQRIARLREQPDFARERGRDVQVLGLEPANPNDLSRGYTSLAVLVTDRALNLNSVEFEKWDSELAAREWQLVSTALARGGSLQEISSFSPAVARTLAANAVVAVVLSLLGMLLYIWVRFGSLRYSMATVTALTFNVIICLGALALTHTLAGTRFASMILLDEYRIDLNVIAALLTIIGYSLNDTIVILDRVRENRGKRLFATPEIINKSINQTFSRTVLTGGSTILAAIILFVLGGTGIQPFAFTFLIGLLVGTFSSVAIAAPLVSQGPPPAAQTVQEPKFIARDRAASPGTVAPAAS